MQPPQLLHRVAVHCISRSKFLFRTPHRPAADFGMDLGHQGLQANFKLAEDYTEFSKIFFAQGVALQALCVDGDEVHWCVADVGTARERVCWP